MPSAERKYDVAILSQGGLVAALHLRCPKDRGALAENGESLRCGHCGAAYPVVGGVPILINDASSVFAIGDYLDGAGYEGNSYGCDWERAGPVRRWVHRTLRRIGDTPSNIRRFGNSDAFAEVRRSHARPRVLVVGAGGVRYGAEDDEVVHTDVAFAAHVQVIADAHDLPFPDQDFDLVLAVAVLEHVADPQRCVGEFWRVLKSDGCVFATTPFLQPVHMGAYDFTRFTPLGHRRLFRHFDEIRRGCGHGGWKHGRLGAFCRPGVDLGPARLAALRAPGRAPDAGSAPQARSVAGRSRALGRRRRVVLFRPSSAASGQNPFRIGCLSDVTKAAVRRLAAAVAHRR